jgi:hypothetical protein
MTPRHLTIWIFAALLASACGGAPKPTDDLVNTQAAVRSAREVGAGGNADAKLHLVLAQEQLQKANKLMEDGDNAEAARVLQRARADAELAIALTRRADEQSALSQERTKLNASQTPPLTMNTSQ